MAHYVISAVRLERAPGGTHDHIASVKLTNGVVETRTTVIRNITNGDVYVTNATPPARVYIYPCPHCRASDYITTHPDSSTTNNLLHLPRF